MKHPADRAISRYRYWTRKLKDLEKSFDSFVRANRDNESARTEYAAKANRVYFDIKSKLESIRAEYWVARNSMGPLCAKK